MAIDPKDPAVQEYIRQESGREQAGKPKKPAEKPPETTGKKQHGPFKKRRAGVVLSKDEVREIKAGRKKLRKEMREQGIRSRQEFELTAGSLGLYFDKNRFWAFLLWLLRGRGLWVLLGLLGLLMLLLFLFSLITQMRGHFTINMAGNMFREGFSLSETVDFANPVSQLFAQPAEDVPCISIRTLPEDVDSHDGEHNDLYFAYTFYVRNEGESTQDYTWELRMNSESRNLSQAAWVMVFEDGKMAFYARPSANGGREALPAFEDDSRGYPEAPLRQFAGDPEDQYQEIVSASGKVYYRIVPKNFESGTVVTSGRVDGVQPLEVHKYTVVTWLEGDDPDCTNELIGGHLGLEMQFRLVEKEEEP